MQLSCGPQVMVMAESLSVIHLSIVLPNCLIQHEESWQEHSTGLHIPAFSGPTRQKEHLVSNSNINTTLLNISRHMVLRGLFIDKQSSTPLHSRKCLWCFRFNQAFLFSVKMICCMLNHTGNFRKFAMLPFVRLVWNRFKTHSSEREKTIQSIQMLSMTCMVIVNFVEIGRNWVSPTKACVILIVNYS